MITNVPHPTTSPPTAAESAFSPAMDDPLLRDLFDRCRQALARNATRGEILALLEDIADTNRDRLRAEQKAGIDSRGSVPERRIRARVRLLENLTKVILALRAGDADTDQRIISFLDGPPHPYSSTTLEEF